MSDTAPPADDRLTAAIRENMTRHWLEDEPSEDCLDYSEENTSAVKPLKEWLRKHLLECSRCRMLYAAILHAEANR